MTRPSIAQHENEGRTFVIAEVAQAHDGSLGILHSFIDAAAEAKVDAVKFQVHIAEAESSAHEPFRVQFSKVDATRADYWRRMGLSQEQWTEIKSHCEALSVEFLATPFSNLAVDLLDRIGVQRYKIGSGDVTNRLLVERIARTGKETILSTGLATLAETRQVVERLQKNGVAVLQCTTAYPTAPEDVGLRAIPELRKQLGCPSGLSDHSGTIFAGIAAAALGASVVEAHITFDRRMYGPDAKASLTISEFVQLVEGIRFVEQAQAGDAGKTLTPGVNKLREVFGRSLAVNRDLSAGHKLAFDDLEAKKPAGYGIHPSDIDRVLGKMLKRPKARWEFLKDDDLQ